VGKILKKLELMKVTQQVVGSTSPQPLALPLPSVQTQQVYSEDTWKDIRRLFAV
jgi:hypothetical protein